MPARLSRSLLAFLWIAAATCASLARAAAPHPNVLIILADDQGYGDLHCTGNPQAQTPNIDRLASAGITFDRFFVSPLCAPTRAGFLTGRYPLRTGVFGVDSGAETMRSDEVTLAEALRDSPARYHTGIFGKWHNGEHYPCTPRGQGFEEFFGFTRGHWNNYFGTTLQHNEQLVKADGFIIDSLTGHAIEFIESTPRDRPFFCYVAYNTPHSPFQVPEKYFARYKAMGLDDKNACVYGMGENIDDNVGRLLAKLDELKVRDDTIVIYFSDNGPNGVRFNAGMRGTKGSLHEGGSREPFFLQWPSRFTSPRTITPIAAHVDLFPTLLDLCGVPMPKTRGPLDGRSLVPLLDGRVDWADRAVITQHQRNHNRAAVRTQRFRLVNEGKGWELFDMIADPGEARDVSAGHPDVKKQLLADYENYWASVQPDIQQGAPPIPVGYERSPLVTLPAAEARPDGGPHLNNRFPNNSWLLGFSTPASSATWRLDVVHAGTYEVTLEFLCPASDAGSKVTVTAPGDAAAASATIPATPMRQLDSPDRVPRTETYEMEWSSLRVGTILLPKGPAELKLQSPSVAGKDALWLKSVQLRRVQ